MSMLIAEARVAGTDAVALASRLLEHMKSAGNFQPVCFPESGRAEFPWGRAFMTAESGELLLRAEAQEERYLGIVKFLVVTRLEEIARDAAAEVVWRGDCCDAKVLPGFRELRLESHRDVTPHVRRLTFRGDDLTPYDSGSMHVSLFFPPDGLAEPEWPRPSADGRTVWPPDDRRPAARIYTIRALDVARGTMDIDFVRHAGTGIASGFAERAEHDALVGCTGPIGRKIPDADFYLLAGDETAIPAIARILEKLPASARGAALIEADNADERQFFACKADVDIRWLWRGGAAAGTTTLLEDAARSVALPRDRKLFAWAGVESATARALRGYWRGELGLTTKQSLAVGYWRR